MNLYKNANDKSYINMSSSFSLYMKNISSSELFPDELLSKDVQNEYELLEEGLLVAYPIMNKTPINVEGYGFYVNTETNNYIPAVEICNTLKKRIPITILNISNTHNKTKIKYTNNYDGNVYYNVGILFVIGLFVYYIIIIL